jgi:uncharacterized protein (TIGR02246 family)
VIRSGHPQAGVATGHPVPERRFDREDGAMPTPQEPSGDQASIAAIHHLVAEAERLQNDLEGFTALLTDDAVIVNFGGRRVRGRDAIHRAMRVALDSPLADVVTTQTVESVRFVRPDVALVELVKYIDDRRERSEPGSVPLADRGMLTFVVVEQQGEWRIASAQTTPVAA